MNPFTHKHSEQGSQTAEIEHEAGCEQLRGESFVCFADQQAGLSAKQASDSPAPPGQNRPRSEFPSFESHPTPTRVRAPAPPNSSIYLVSLRRS